MTWPGGTSGVNRPGFSGELLGKPGRFRSACGGIGVRLSAVPCPALQGCYTEGETEEEARALIKDAIRLHIEERLAAGEPIYAEVGTARIRVAV